MKKITRYLTPKNLSYLLIAVYVLSLIPLLWIGHYNYPSADDYSEALQAHRAFVETGSVLRAFGAAIQRSVHDYFHWMGYFTCNLLMAFSPTVFGPGAYAVTAWIMLGMLSLSTYYLLQTLLVKVFGGDRYVSRCIIMVMLFITVQCMVGRVEAFYWYSGAANYILVHCFLLFFYGLLVSLGCDLKQRSSLPDATAAGSGARKTGIWKLVLASFLGLVSGLGNQMSALNGAIIVSVVVGFLIFFKKQKEYRLLFIPMGFYYLGFLLNVASPGNFVRAESQTGMNPLKAIFVSLYYGLDYCLSDWSPWPVLLLILILVPLFAKLLRKTAFPFRYPGIVVLFGFGVVSAMMTPPLFALGNIGAGRLQAVTYTMYILVLTLCVGYVTGWGVKRFVPSSTEDSNKDGVAKETITEKTAGNAGHDSGFSSAEVLLILGCLLFFAFGSVLSVIPDPHYYSFTSAVTDLRNGAAKSYHDTWKAREEIFLNGEKDAVVPDLPAEPALLFFQDLSEDPEEWQNGSVARYYGLNSVRVEDTSE